MERVPTKTDIIAEIAKGGIAGDTQKEIAKRLGIHQTTVSKIQRQPEIKAYIESEIEQLMRRGLSQARRTVCRFAAKGNIKDAKIEEQKLALDASKVILSHAQGAPGTVVNTLIQINQAPAQAAELTALNDFLAHTWKNQVIDVDTTDESK